MSTLVCPVLLATTGLFVPKLAVSGSVAGGIDTMAVIPGFDSKIGGEKFIEILRCANIAHAEPSANFCPADRSLVKARRERGMMANSGLAAASLLGKKLAIPGTAALFDFRVGPEGNIGRDVHEAEQAEEMFLKVGASLGIHVATIKTDNRVFPCSALGRLESLDLLWGILNNSNRLLSLDQIHMQTCCALATEARRLVNGRLDTTSSNQELLRLLSSGAMLKTFDTHLEVQGASVDGLTEVLEIYSQQVVFPFYSRGRGYWSPPDLGLAKNWVKREQKRAQEQRRSLGNDPRVQVGLRLIRAPGDFVQEGETVVEVRYPAGFSPLAVPQDFAGGIVDHPIASIKQILQ